MYVCVRVCVNMRMYVCVHVCERARVCVCVCVSTTPFSSLFQRGGLFPHCYMLHVHQFSVAAVTNYNTTLKATAVYSPTVWSQTFEVSTGPKSGW